MTSIYKKAMQQKLRFNHKGVITTEDLWSLSLNELDTIYKSINTQMKSAEEDSLLDSKSPENETLKLKIEILKDIVNTKLEEREAAVKRVATAKERAKILKVLDKKTNSKYDEMSEEELRAELSNLDD